MTMRLDSEKALLLNDKALILLVCDQMLVCMFLFDFLFPFSKADKECKTSFPVSIVFAVYI